VTATPLDQRDREALFADLGAQCFDLAVIGAGVTGAGIARDAAQRGLSVALVEAADFASGTSSRSSKMIHGGLRYLAQGDLGLVREAASERKIVRAIAPHLAIQTPFVIGARSATAVAKLRAGLWTFEKLGGVDRDHVHEMWSAKELAEREPAMRTEGLVGALVYPEYLTNDARLTLANVMDARAHGAVVVSRAAVESFEIESGRAIAAAVVDTLPGGTSHAARLRAKVFVNAAGPWVDAVRALESGAADPRLALSRGIHIVVAHKRAPVQRTLIIPAGGGRSIFVVPKGEVTYIGTTDAFFAEAQFWPPIAREDVLYLLEAANARLSGRPLLTSDITAAWSGLRPLVAQAGKGASEVSRRDEVWTGPGRVIAIAGGKLTAYRRMAERVVDQVEKALGRRPSPCRTAESPLPGGERTPTQIRPKLSRLGDAAAARLIGLYGAAAPSVLGGARAEAAHAVLAEGALTLEDYWVRRSGRAWFSTDGGLKALEPAAKAMAPLLGWSEAHTAAEIEVCLTRRAHDMAEVIGDGDH
jgi:glycerol-3-phosphate dehydrogenase